MSQEKLKLKTKIKFKIYKIVDILVNFMFKVKLLKIDDDIKNKILKDAQDKEASFVGGKDKFDLREIRVEIINRCNTTCIMCPRENQKRKAGKMGIDFYEKLIKEAYELGARALYPYHMGESLILKYFCEYIKIAKNIGYTTIMLTTTGGLIKQYDPEELVTCGLTILNFSIDSVKQSSYEKIRTNMKLKEIEESVKKIIEAKNRLNPGLEVSVKYMDYPGINDGEWPVFEEKWADLADTIYHTVLLDWGGKTDLNVGYKFTPDEYCRYLRQKLIFGWDGTAMFCCMDYDNQLPIGKYPEQGIEEIMKSPKLLKAREMHHQGTLSKHPMCKMCYMNMDQAVVSYYKDKYKNRFINTTNKLRGKSIENI